MIRVHPSRSAAEHSVAAEIVRLVAARTDAVLGLATGSTMIGVYEEVRTLAAREGVGFGGVTTFNLDEYAGLERGDPRSFRAYMDEHLFRPLGFDPARTWFPDVEADDVVAAARAFEVRIEEAGGIDLQLLGIGRNGHVGFNEPGAARASRTRRVELDVVTREDAAAEFGGAAPEFAVTMGVATILDARALRVLAFGERKNDITRRALRGPVGPDVPATYLRGHPDVEFHLDEAAARGL